MQIEETETTSQKQYSNISKTTVETFRNTCCNISNRLLQHRKIHNSREIREKEGRHMGWDALGVQIDPPPWDG
jgi:hypothetical protein